MLAWRDMKNPLKGGAEVVTDIYCKGLVDKGHEVVLFASAFPNCAREETYNNYTILRKGGRLSVYWHASKYVIKNIKSFDYIIDQVNTLPFFTPLYVSKKKRIAFFHQLAMNVWFYETNFLIATIGICLEWLYLKLYMNTRAFVVSKSTKQDLMNYALAKSRNILVLDNQIDFKPVAKIPEKEDYFVFCGRLKKSKRVHDCIKAIANVPGAKLKIIGDGDEKYKLELHQLVKQLHIKNKVEFLGFRSFKERNMIMGKAQAILVTSIREGWGLIVTEANTNGTMAITYDVPGLRDANKKGIITKKNDFKELVKEMRAIFKNKELNLNYSRQSLNFAKQHINWDEKINELEKWMSR